VFIQKHKPDDGPFSIQKDAIFFKVKEIKGLRGDVLLYVAVCYRVVDVRRVKIFLKLMLLNL